MRIAALLLVLLASLPARAASVTEAVFGAHPLANVTEPATLRYRFEVRGEGMEPYRAPALMEVREVLPDGRKTVFFDLFEGADRRRFGPQPALDQNPLVIVFLQLDVNEMGNLTGGSPGYFQQQIRRAFNAEAETRTVEVEVGGETVTATQLRMRPFAHDPAIGRFAAFRDKIYEFVVAPEVPGGLVRIAARTPDPTTGDLIIEKSMTFEAVER